MSTLLTKAPCYTERLIAARVQHRCDDYPACPTGIRPGERYLECKVFPGHDAGDYRQPLAFRLCERSSTFERRMEFREPDGQWHCTTDHVTEPCGRCGPCRETAARNRVAA